MFNFSALKLVREPSVEPRDFTLTKRLEKRRMKAGRCVEIESAPSPQAETQS